MNQNLAVLILSLTVLVAPLPVSASDDPFLAGLEAYDAGRLIEAAAAFDLASRNGNLEATVALAGLYMDGRGVPLDPRKGANLYRKAAEAGNSLAQLNLGDLYSSGQGVRRDLEEAHYWLSLAAQQGRKWPIQKIAEIEGSMSEAELNVARQRAIENKNSL